jgi:phenylacetate-coenzyme A ligase PaaK-like adenylate-forming protein
MAALITKLKLFGFSDRLIRRNPLFYAHAARLLRDFNTLDAAGQRDWRHGRLRQIIAAARRSDYGKRTGAGEFLGDWPILEKEPLRAEPKAFRTTECWFTVSAATSGTTGAPVRLRRSLWSVAYEQALSDHLLASGGVDPLTCRTAVLRGDDVKNPADRSPPFWRLANGGRRLIFSSNHLDEASVGHFVDALRKYSPDVVFAYPTVLASLCSLMLRRGLRLQVPLTVCGSEVLTKGTSDFAREALGTRVIGHYGQAERVAWAAGDPENGYRFDPTYAVNELRFVRAAEAADVYEIIGTGLWNRAMPLIRYSTGDQIRVRKGDSPTAVAEGRETFLGVIGRSGDYLIAPSGARLLGIDHIPRNVPNIVRAQFIQESTQSVTLLVIPAPGFDDESRRLLLQHASRKLPPSMRIRIETTTQLVRNRSGKAPLIVRNIVDGAP